MALFSSHFDGLGTDTGTVNTVMLTAAITAVFLSPFTGAAGQRYGRRQVFLVLDALNAIVAPILLGLAIAEADQTLFVIICGALTRVCTLLVWSMISAYILEMFPTQVRSSGYGIAYSLPSVIPAFYSYYMLGPSELMPYEYTPSCCSALAGYSPSPAPGSAKTCATSGSTGCSRNSEQITSGDPGHSPRPGFAHAQAHSKPPTDRLAGHLSSNARPQAG